MQNGNDWRLLVRPAGFPETNKDLQLHSAIGKIYATEKVETAA